MSFVEKRHESMALAQKHRDYLTGQIQAVKFQKFEVGDCVVIARLVGPHAIETEQIIGKKSVITEVDDLPNGDYNYCLKDGTYVHEEELETDIPATVIKTLKGGQTNDNAK